MSKRIVCLFLALILCVGLLPFSVLAAEGEEAVSAGGEVSGITITEEVTSPVAEESAAEEVLASVTEEEISEEESAPEEPSPEESETDAPDAEEPEEIDPENIIEILPIPETGKKGAGLFASAPMGGTGGLQFISDLAVGSEDAIAFCTIVSRMKNAGYSVVQRYFTDGTSEDYDCNKDAGGYYIFLGNKTVSDFAANMEDLITGLVICVNFHKDEFTWNGKTYYPVSKGIGDTDFNLNQGSGGDALYLYYTHDGAEKGAPVLTSLSGTKSFSEKQSSANYVSGVVEDSSDPSGYSGIGSLDLNKAVSGSSFIYLNAYYHTHKITVHSDTDGHWETCSECSYVSARESHDGHWEDGVCSVCGYECPHTDESGTFCSVCGLYLGNHACEDGKYLDYDSTSNQLVSRDIPDGTKPVTAESTSLEAGWYTVADTLTIDGRMMLGGDVHIILMDGADLTVSGGIGLQTSASLTVYAQSTGAGAGKLTTGSVQDGHAGIGSAGEGLNFITINGGNIKTTGGAGGAGIGGSSDTINNGDITINGGFVTAIGGSGAAGIGTGDNGTCLNITLNGGTVLATGGSGADGIGAGVNGSILHTAVNGGFIRADRGSDSMSAIAAANVSKKVKYDSGDGEAYRTVNCVYYPPVEPTCTATGLMEYYKSSLDGCYYTAMPFSSGAGFIEEDIRTKCLVPMVPHTFEILDLDRHICSVCHITEEHSFDEDGDCACGLSTHGEESLSFRVYGEDGVWRTLYLPESALTEITGPGEYGGGWYILRGEQNLETIIFTGSAYLILANGSDISCHGVILQKGVSITIFDQSADESKMGKLTTEAPDSSGGIGTYRRSSCDDITIHGGNITASCPYWYGPGIGAGSDGTCGDITIHGGIIKANGNAFSSGIGSGPDGICGNITITGGTINAGAGENAAGIGSGWDGTCGDINISGGIITATGGANAAGIGNADSVDSSKNATCGSITITGGIITATAGNKGDSIGNSRYGNCGPVTLGENMAAYELLEDGTLLWQLDNAEQLADITCARVQERIPDFDCPSYLDYENRKPVHKLIPSDATEITAPGEYEGGWYILEDEQALNGQIIFKGDAHVVLKNGATIKTQGIVLQEGVSLALYSQSAQKGTMGRLTVKNVPYQSAGIGGSGSNKEIRCGDIVINGGELDITGGGESAGIGGGSKGGCGNITINGGDVKVTGSNGGAGIGGGYFGACGNITINNGSVDATAGDYGAGIGGGNSSLAVGTITINNGTVQARATMGAPGIGSGYYGHKCQGVTVNGGVINAEGGTNAPGIGASVYANCGVLTFNGGVTTATGGSLLGEKGNCGSIGNGRKWYGTSSTPGKCDEVKLGSGMGAVELTVIGLPIPHLVGGLKWLNEVKSALIANFSFLYGNDGPVPGGDDEPTTGGESEEPVPQTGDTSHAELWLILACLSAISATVILRKKKS